MFGLRCLIIILQLIKAQTEAGVILKEYAARRQVLNKQLSHT